MYSISPYKLNMYLECPRHYWWNYINPSTRSLPQTKPYFTMGDHVHNALKHFFNLEPSRRSKPVLLQLLADHWQLKAGKDGGFWTPEIEHEYKDRAQLMLSAFCDNEDITIVPLWASDKNVKVPVSEDLDFLGRIDRVDETPEGLHIIDYKTSREEREDEWQLPMYAVMARRFFKKPVAKLSYLFLETGSWLSVPANPARETFTIARVQQIVDSMPHSLDKAAWLCIEADGCTHCDYLKEVGLDPLGESIELPKQPI
jgi:putative RecB family exonuclease